MSDDIDRAQTEVERSLNQALRNRNPEGPAPRGECLWCEAPFADDTSRWCDTHCRDMWEKRGRR